MGITKPWQRRFRPWSNFYAVLNALDGTDELLTAAQIADLIPDRNWASIRSTVTMLARSGWLRTESVGDARTGLRRVLYGRPL